jgi:hypothetical protein
VLDGRGDHDVGDSGPGADGDVHALGRAAGQLDLRLIGAGRGGQSAAQGGGMLAEVLKTCVLTWLSRSSDAAAVALAVREPFADCRSGPRVTEVGSP